MISLTVLLLLKIKVYNLQYKRVANSILQLAGGCSKHKISKNDIKYCLDIWASGFTPC